MIHQEALNTVQAKFVSHLLIASIFKVSILMAKENGKPFKKRKSHRTYTLKEMGEKP